jgi:hypothetical protein
LAALRCAWLLARHKHCRPLPSPGPQDKDTPLSDLQRDKFEDLLRGLTAERGAVRDAMVFALDHADCAAEVVDILAEALTLDETPIPTKVQNTACCGFDHVAPSCCHCEGSSTVRLSHILAEALTLNETPIPTKVSAVFAPF